MTTVPQACSSKPAHGFTLIELMVTVLIVSILAAVALPVYSGYVIRGHLTEGQTILAGFGTSLQQYYQDNRSWVSACGASTVIGGVPDATPDFTFACTSHTATDFLATATGNAAATTAGFVFTLDSNGNRATTSVPTGWTPSSTCWVRNTSGNC